MIFVVFLATALAVTVRVRRKLFCREEAVLLAVVLTHYAMVVAQTTVCCPGALPEARYLTQASVLLYGYLAWTLLELAGKVRFLIRLPLACALALLALAVGMLLKPHVPGARRAAYVRACDWAVERIAADWKGPPQDAKNAFSLAEYHCPNRPVVCAHVARVPYLLGGRTANPDLFGSVDMPDYIVDEVSRLWRPPDGTPYVTLDSLKVGKREFLLLKRGGNRP